jgi:hypothetical protein
VAEEEATEFLPNLVYVNKSNMIVETRHTVEAMTSKGGFNAC